MPENFCSQPIEQLYTQLSSSSKGLTAVEAQKRFKAQQKELQPESRLHRDIKLYLSQFKSPLVLLLVAAVILSAVLGQVTDTFIILFILIATGTLSFVQELNAGRAVEKLRQLIDLKHQIIRDGKEIEVGTAEVVPGDLLTLNAGDVIPADCRIIESNELHVNESSLTGESFPVEKMAGIIDEQETLSKKTNCLWQSTNIISGTATALVVNTGDATIFGQMAHSLIQVNETVFEKGIKQFGYFLLRITVILAIVILVANIYFGKHLFDAVLFSLAVAVGMAPELLPAIMTFAMSAGAKRMMTKKVIVKKLSSIFNLGEVNLLCTDKTGTITDGIVQVKDMVNLQGKSDETVRFYAYLNSSLQNGFENPLDNAIKILALDTKGYTKLNEVPYDFLRKRLSVAIQGSKEKFIITKGALDNVLEVCTQVKNGENVELINDIIRGQVKKLYTDYCESGLRVLGVAYKEIVQDRITRDDEKGMTLVGFIVLEDPLKASAADSIARLAKMSVGVKIITGDNRFTSLYIAKKLGIENPKIITGDMLHSMTPEALIVNAAATDVFAEIEPNQKEWIVRSLQKSNFVVAYMGDGINDVAAIHAADTGISTSNAVDVAKEAADVVLLENDLSVIADGIYEGRKSFTNSMKYIFINTGATFGNMFSVAGASFLLPFLPMLPKQILLTNFITDFPYLSIASDNVDEDQLRSPQKWDMRLIRNFMIIFGIHSSLFDLATFITFYKYFHLSDSPFQTSWFLESVITELLILFIIRTRHSFITSKPGKVLLITSIIAFFITILLPISPFAGMLGLSIAHYQQVMAIGVILVAYVITADLLKIAFFRNMASRNHSRPDD